jgi:hypothetical protein
MTALESYLRTLLDHRDITVSETAHYPALQTLLNSIGADLRPKVKAVLHIKNSGAGIPDLALYDESRNRRQGLKPPG